MKDLIVHCGFGNAPEAFRHLRRTGQPNAVGHTDTTYSLIPGPPPTIGRTGRGFGEQIATRFGYPSQRYCIPFWWTLNSDTFVKVPVEHIDQQT